MNRINKGKIVYWVNGQRFENSKDKRDGREKAEKYCLDNFINPQNIQKFDSRTETNRYEYLLSLEEKGEISNLGHHFTLKVQDEFENANGDTIPAITYEADFVYKEMATGKRIVEDVKGSEYFLDERFITLKQVFDNLMKEKGLYIRVMLFRDNQWIEWRIGEKKKSQKLIKKQRELLKAQKELLRKQETESKKTEREKTRYLELREACENGTITRQQAKRFNELTEILRKKGIMI